CLPLIFFIGHHAVPCRLFPSGSESYTPKSDEAKLFCILDCTLGIPLTLLLLTRIPNLLPAVTHAPIHHLHTYWGLHYCQAALVHAGLLCVLVLALLFFPPFLLVCATEPSWSILDALFFCFVFLSNVGHGGKSLGRHWSLSAKETLQILTTCYLLLGPVVIITFKQTVLQVPWVSTVVRLFSGPQYAELEGVHLSELTFTEESCEEEPQYSQSICTLFSTSPEVTGPAVTHRPPWPSKLDPRSSNSNPLLTIV
ncbi:potassium channel, subfamily K, member 7, partial [Spinachia spinachia]